MSSPIIIITPGPRTTNFSTDMASTDAVESKSISPSDVAHIFQSKEDAIAYLQSLE